MYVSLKLIKKKKKSRIYGHLDSFKNYMQV